MGVGMTTSNESFLEKIESNLKKNGFPERAVAFPLEKLYESAHEAGANLNKILEDLALKGIQNEKTVEKIIFTKKITSSDDIMSQFEGMNMDDVRAKSEQMMKDMPPEQLEYAKQMFANMSEQEKKDMMAKAMQMFGGKN